ncbi:DUF4293 domain-containing protein [Dysgonomonas macrotermitis]|uniref:DUF4293 family protein n=1 Tax=Dysgonomonas macrotermitis TaxID=1346286 RepID=A0A1M4UDN1_9BACT|nr:DUF4293 domain-containing protein [Dysgonomonas macrotermitis]SHE54784.1 protein of unknown function [Dysgonomonas macrotermitis]
MIQRIQSIFLLVAAILMAVTVFSPLAFLADNADGYFIARCLGFYKNGVGLEYPTCGVIVIAALVTVLLFITIFLYKKRKLQLKLCYTSIVIILAFYGTFYAYLQAGLTATATTFVNVKYGLLLPVIALIFIILAITKIKADEKLIQSLNRIR